MNNVAETTSSRSVSHNLLSQEANIANQSSQDTLDSRQAIQTISVSRLQTLSKDNIKSTDRRKPDRAFTISSFDSNMRKPFIAEPLVRGNQNELIANSNRYKNKSKTNKLPQKFPVYDIMTQISDFPDKAAGYDHCIQSPEIKRTASVGADYLKHSRQNLNCNGQVNQMLAKSMVNVHYIDDSSSHLEKNNLYRSASADVRKPSTVNVDTSAEIQSNQNNHQYGSSYYKHNTTKPALLHNKITKYPFARHGMNTNKNITGSFPLLYNKNLEHVKGKYHTRSSSGGDRDPTRKDFQPLLSDLTLGKSYTTAATFGQLPRSSNVQLKLPNDQKSSSLTDLTSSYDDPVVTDSIDQEGMHLLS